MNPARRAAARLAAGAAPITVAVAAQSAGNLAFHSVVGRLLDPGSYGALGAVLSAMVMLAVPLGALQTAASALAAEHGLTGPVVRRTLRSVALWSLGPALLVLAAAPALRDYFRLASVAEAAWLAPYALAAAVVAAARGLLLGGRRLGVVAGTYLVGTAARLVLGLALIVPFGVAGALAGTAAAELAALLLAVSRLHPDRPGPAEDPARRHPPGSPSRRHPADSAAGSGPAASPARRDQADGPERPGLRLRSVAHAGFAVTGLFLFSTADLLLARHHLPDAASGSYVAAATIAKTVLALPAAVMAAVFPRLIAAWPTPGRARALRAGLIAVAGPAVLGALAVAAVPGFVLGLLYGDAYAGDTGLVRALCAIAALTSLVNVLTHAALARRAWTVVVPWAGAGLEVALIELWHGSAAQVAAGSAAALGPVLLLAAVVEGRRWTKAQVAPASADPRCTAATAA